MTAVAGIDFDSNGIFVAVVDEDSGGWVGQITCDLQCGPGDALARARRVRDLMPARGSWADSGIVAIGLESTFSRDFRAATALCRIQGAIIACLPRDVPLQLLTAGGRRKPGWKLLTVGAASDLTTSSKAEVKEWALEHGAPPGLVQDHYDAFCIARATRRQQGGSTAGGPS